MSLKTIFIIIISVIITVILMQNTDEVLFTLLWKQIYVSKLIMLLIVTFFGFIIGVIVARPKKKKVARETSTLAQKDIPLEMNPSDEAYINTKKPNQLSDEDRDYLS